MIVKLAILRLVDREFAHAQEVGEGVAIRL